MLEKALVITALALAGAALARPPHAEPGPVLVLDARARDAMSSAFLRFNAHWDEQADLNQMERMLGTVRPVAREYLGCLQGERRGDTVVVTSWVEARHLRQLPQAVTGDCDGVPGLIGSWHTHPFRPDSANRPIKERALSAQDLRTLETSPAFAAVLVMWDADSVDAAVRDRSGAVVHPVRTALAGGPS